MARVLLNKEHGGYPAGSVIEVTAHEAANLVLCLVGVIDRNRTEPAANAPGTEPQVTPPKAKKKKA